MIRTTTATWSILALAALCLIPTAGEGAEPSHGPAIDHDRIHYVRPYARALEQARREHRILVVRPFPVGGVNDGSRDGRWCPLADYMRAVTLSDETVVTLLNRRFVFTYFSLVDWSELSDPEAKRAIVRVAPDLGEKIRRTPPTFFFSPDGEVLGRLETMASASSFLHLATSLLAEHSEYDRPTSEETRLAAESARDPRPRVRLARLQLELAHVDEAKQTLASLLAAGPMVPDAVRAEALYLLAQRARIEADAELAERRLAELEQLPKPARAALEDDIRMERAHGYALRGDWRRALEAWSDIETEVPALVRKDELLYAKGLSYYHLGNRREANYTWVRVMRELAEGRYYQKARLAALGPAYSPTSPDLVLAGGTPPRRYFSLPADPTRLPGAELGYGTSPDGHAGTEQTPERFLRRAYRDYAEIQRRLAMAHDN